jgi:hypothetical protein
MLDSSSRKNSGHRDTLFRCRPDADKFLGDKALAAGWAPPSLFYTSGRTRRCPAGFGARPGVPHARSGRAGEIYRFGPIAEKQEKIICGRRAGTLHARGCMGRAFVGGAAGCSIAWRLEEVYPSRASGRSICPAAIGEKRKISLAHPPRVCPHCPRRGNHGPATLRCVEQQGLRPPSFWTHLLLGGLTAAG